VTTVDYAVAGPVLARFHASNAPVRVLVGPIGSGKSTCCAVEAFRRVTEQPPGPDGVRRSRGLVVRQTFRQLSGTTVPTWRALFDEAFGTFRWSEPFTHELR
jgi:hypothetical protein